jgi:hypothetical protein
MATVLPHESVLIMRGEEVGIGGHELVEQAGVALRIAGTLGSEYLRRYHQGETGKCGKTHGASICKALIHVISSEGIAIVAKSA